VAGRESSVTVRRQATFAELAQLGLIGQRLVESGEFQVDLRNIGPRRVFGRNSLLDCASAEIIFIVLG